MTERTLRDSRAIDATVAAMGFLLAADSAPGQYVDQHILIHQCWLRASTSTRFAVTSPRGGPRIDERPGVCRRRIFQCARRRPVSRRQAADALRLREPRAGAEPRPPRGKGAAVLK